MFYYFSLAYLIIIVIYGWFLEFDVYINFLMVIDLGLFFIILAFVINFTNLYNYNFTQAINFKNTLLLVSLSLIIYFVYIVSTDYNCSTSPLNNNLISISLTNWYDLYNTVYMSDLQLWSDIYYILNFFEFVVANLIIYVGITVIVLIIKITDNIHMLKNNLNFKTYFKNNELNYDIFMKYQNTQKQVNKTGLVRVWTKKLQKKFI